jgi:hypothetical protein
MVLFQTSIPKLHFNSPVLAVQFPPHITLIHPLVDNNFSLKLCKWCSFLKEEIVFSNNTNERVNLLFLFPKRKRTLFILSLN